MEIQYTSRGINEWLSMIRNMAVALPAFQRSYVWATDKKVKLMEAILNGRPIGMLMILECEKGKPSIGCRDFAHLNRKWNHEEVVEQLLDGQQRLTSIREMLEEPGYYIELDGVDIFEDEDSDYNPNNIEIKSVLHHTPKTAPGKKYMSKPSEALAAGLIPVDMLYTRLLAHPNSTWEKDKILKWCQDACGERSNGYIERLSSYIQDYLYTPLLMCKLRQCVLPKGMPTSEAIRIFIGTNQNATVVTEFDIVVAHADDKYGLKMRENIAEFCDSDECKHIRHYVNKKGEVWIPEVGTWMLKIACLKSETKTAPNGVAPKESLFFDAFNNLLKGNDVKASGNGALRSRKTIETHARKQLSILLKGLDGALGFIFENGIPGKKGISNRPAIHVLAALQEIESKIRNPNCQGFAKRLLTMYFWSTFFSARYLRQANDRLLEDFQEMKMCLRQASDGDIDPDTSKCPFLDPKHGALNEDKLADELKNLDDPWPWLYQGRKGCAIAAVIRKNAKTDWVSGACISGTAIRDLEENIQASPTMTPKEKNLKRLDCHHVFPKGFFETELRNSKLSEKLLDHGMNGTFLLNQSNITISDKDPACYIKNLVGDGKNTKTGEVVLRERLEEQHIAYDDLVNDKSMDSVEKYKLFLVGRADLLAKEIGQLVRQKGR